MGSLLAVVGWRQGLSEATSLCKRLQRNQGHDPPLNLPSSWEGQMYPRDLMRLCHEVCAGAGTEGRRTEKQRSKEAERRGLELRQQSKHQARILGLVDPQQCLDCHLRASFSGRVGVRSHPVPASDCGGSSLAGRHSPHPTALLPLQHMVSHPLCFYERSETNPILHTEKLGQEGRPGSRLQ